MSLKKLAVAAALLLAVSAQGRAETPRPDGGAGANFAAWLASSVKEYVISELSEPGVDIESVDVSAPATFTPPDSFDSIDIAMPGQNRRGSSLFLLVTFRGGGKAVSRVNVIASVKIMRTVVVARKDIRKGVIIGPDDVELERKLTGPSADHLVSGISGALGREADRNIRAGMELRSDQLSWPKMVNMGDMVTVTAESGRMRITTLGKAKQDGDMGEWIKVQNIESNKTITARVAGPGEVTVEF